MDHIDPGPGTMVHIDPAGTGIMVYTNLPAPLLVDRTLPSRIIDPPSTPAQKHIRHACSLAVLDAHLTIRYSRS